jgi:lysophospholipase L1-like esterase
MRRWLPELLALPLLPYLIVQGRHTRRITPRLPEAQGPSQGVAGLEYQSLPLTLLTVGESPVAGVGVDTHEQAITGQLAQALATAAQRPVSWQACGRNGVTAGEAMKHLVPALPRQSVDIALVAFGVNDTTAFRSVARWRRDLQDLVAAIDRQCRPQIILLSGVPPVSRFPALPQPLRWVMGLKASALDAATRDLAPRLPRTHYVPLLLDPQNSAMMASDGYHPSAAGCTAWGALLAAAAIPMLTLRLPPTLKASAAG